MTEQESSPITAALLEELRAIDERRARISKERNLLGMLIEIVLDAAEALATKERALQDRQIDLKEEIDAWQRLDN
jgi:hypothetical protein